jgi:hypothetical protein
MTTCAATDVTAGRRLADALAAKDRDALVALLGDPLDFQALTPGRHWASADPAQVVDEFVLGHWFGARDVIEALDDVVTGRVGMRRHVAYRLRVRRDETTYLVEQQAYYDEAPDGRMTYVRLLCSGYCPVK